MSSVEILSALCARIVRLEAQSRDSAGHRLSGPEIAGYLSGLTADETDYVLAKYCGADAAPVYEHALTYSESLARRHAWKASQNQLRALSLLAADESLSPCRCKKCGGIGYRLSKVCSPCQGTGYRYESANRIAALLEVPATTYRRVWRGRFKQLSDYLLGMDSSVRARVSINSNE